MRTGLHTRQVAEQDDGAGALRRELVEHLAELAEHFPQRRARLHAVPQLYAGAE